MKIGAHVSIAGGIANAPKRAAAIGAECAQTFASSPRGWRSPSVTDDDVAAYKEQADVHDVGPLFFHAIYLVNLATDKNTLRKKSIESLVAYLDLAQAIGADGVVAHIGSHGGDGVETGIERVVDAINEVLDRSHRLSHLLLENTAGGGDTIGRSFEEIGTIIRAVGSERLAVCFDTAHALASGYDVTSKQGARETARSFKRHIGSDRLALVHANDSKAEKGSNVDRHENIGEGHVGRSGFTALMRNRLFSSAPWVLEVPGFDGDGPDNKNIDRLKKIRD